MLAPAPAYARGYEPWLERIHDVRHTAATMLLDGGTTPSATAKPAITLRVYGHVYDDALASAGDALLGRSRGNA